MINSFKQKKKITDQKSIVSFLFFFFFSTNIGIYQIKYGLARFFGKLIFVQGEKTVSLSEP